MTQEVPEGSVLVEERTQPGDPEHAHYAPKALLTDALVFGTPVTALCGLVWVPTRDGMKFPVCPECKAIYDSLPSEPEQ